jgi:hypothetical protein
MELNRSLRRGEKIYFQTESGIGEGVLKCVSVVWFGVTTCSKTDA